MAGKSCSKTLRKEQNRKNNGRVIQDTTMDEIALKDEILDLKRQVMMLKKTNEKNLVKFRKYEDEAKRKDREIEELMDPRKVSIGYCNRGGHKTTVKNSEITKILSTKGAAILMNLRDQNESLIQMVLNKDLQIKRLIAEIKMSKLYASTRKRAHYTPEIIRLRSLVINLQETLKENMRTERREKETRSVCEPFLEISSSSDQSSPRESEELRHTIQSLEMCIKYSNELLSKKNDEISSLSGELNALKENIRLYNHKKAREKRFFDRKESDFWLDGSQLFEKTAKLTEHLPRSAPASSSRWQACFFQTQNPRDEPEEKMTAKDEFLTHPEPKPEEPNQTRNHPTLPTSLFHNMATQEILSTNKSLSARTESEERSAVRRNWKLVLMKYRELHNTSSKTRGKVKERKEKTDEELSNEKFNEKQVDTTKSDVEEPNGESNSKTEEHNIEKPNEILYLDKEEVNGLEEELQSSSDGSKQEEEITINKTEMCPPGRNCDQNSDCCSESPTKSILDFTKNSVENPGEQPTDESKEKELTVDMEAQSTKSTTTISPLSEPKSGALTNSTPRVSYSQILDSSFESENSFSNRQVQVEVQINAVCSPESDKSFEHPEPNCNFGNLFDATPEDDEDDDDDVIVR